MLGTPHISLESVDSTNTYARDLLLRKGASEGTVVTAAHQTAGKGRMDRRWIDLPGQNLLASYILEPQRDVEEWGGVPLLTGIAVLRALRGIAPLDLHLKWPNDVLVENRKIAGILVESGMMTGRPWIITGIGVNCNQTRFEGTYRLPPTSLMLEAGRSCDPEELLSVLSRELDALYRLWQEEGNPPVIEEWKKRTRMLGRPAVLEEPGQRRNVTVMDVSAAGALVVRTADGGIEEIFAGDVAVSPEEDGNEHE